MTQKIDEYLKVAAAAEFLGVSENTVRRWADEGKVASIRNPANNYRLFRRETLTSFLKRAENHATRR